MPLSNEELRKPRELPHEDVPCPELGGDVRIRDWSGVERDEFDSYNSSERSGRKQGDIHGIRASAVAISIVDENGQRVFDCNGDLAIVSAWPDPVLRRLFDRVSERNKIGADAVEDAEKN